MVFSSCYPPRTSVRQLPVAEPFSLFALPWAQLAFSRDALVPLDNALNTILKFAILFGQFRHHNICVMGGRTSPHPARIEANGLPDPKFVRGHRLAPQLAGQELQRLLFPVWAHVDVWPARDAFRAQDLPDEQWYLDIASKFRHVDRALVSA
jgi:hypothetical protein